MRQEQYAVVSYWDGEAGDTKVWIYESHEEAVEALKRLWSMSRDLAMEDDNFCEEYTDLVMESETGAVAWTDDLYRLFEVVKVDAKEQI